MVREASSTASFLAAEPRVRVEAGLEGFCAFRHKANANHCFET
jgi:hypothetical protein